MTSQKNETCFACGKSLGANPARADTRDGQIVFVGHDCMKKIADAGEAGYQPPKGGPRLYPISLAKQFLESQVASGLLLRRA